MQKFIKLAPITLAAVLALGACGTTDEAGKPKPSSQASAGTNANVPDATPSDDATDDASDDSGDDGSDSSVAQFGQTFTFEDGVTITVTKPRPFKPGPYAAGNEGKGVPLSYTVTVVNGTKKALDASQFSSSVQSGDKEAEEVFDSDNGLDGSPSTKVLPGRQSTWKEGYMVKNPADLVVDISSWDYDDAIWTNAS